MALHFTADELLTRRQRTQAALNAGGLDGMLIFRQESMFYLTGYDTFGYVFFQCLYLGQDGRMLLLTRSADRLQAHHTSDIEDIRVWVDGPDAEPAVDLKGVLAEFGLAGKRLGVEWEAYGLTARNGQRLSAALDGFCQLEDVSDLISRLRVIKSPAEIDYVRKAAGLADDAYRAARALTAPGVFEGTILAAMQGAVFEGGGDYPGNEFIIGSGRDALLCRYYTGRRHLSGDDQLTLEWAGVYRHYHAAMMRTFIIGTVNPDQVAMYEAARDALEAVKAAIKPGHTYGEAFAAHVSAFKKSGMENHCLNACGYSLGTTFAPNWMDWPMLYANNPVVFAPGMVVFCHMILFDEQKGLAMTLGETVLVTESGNQRLSQVPLDNVIL
ncbi:MAG: aminopeptidase P family protein [Rhodospirillales bacterium]|nr:aminopeptidase P family protein [Rhodospirillales bacterium]